MTKFEKPVDFIDRGVSDAHGLPSLCAIKAAIVFTLLVAYALGFVMLYPAVQASISRSAAEGADPIAFVGP
jgi:hypothetical protein